MGPGGITGPTGLTAHSNRAILRYRADMVSSPMGFQIMPICSANMIGPRPDRGADAPRRHRNRRRLKMAVEEGAALVGVTRDGQPLSRATPMKLEQEADTSKSLPVNRYRGECRSHTLWPGSRSADHLPLRPRQAGFPPAARDRLQWFKLSTKAPPIMPASPRRVVAPSVDAESRR